MRILFILLFLLALHAIYNLFNYCRYKSIRDLLYGNYTDDIGLKTKAKTHKNRILNYVKNSGVKDYSIPITQFTGYNQVANGKASIFNNFLNQREDFVHHATDMLLEAKGNYWSRFINSFNPFYWLRCILYLPQNLLTYFGVKSDNIAIRIFQVIYWILAAIATFLISVYPEEIKHFISNHINFL